MSDEILNKLENLEPTKLKTVSDKGFKRKTIPIHEISMLIAEDQALKMLNPTNAKEIEEKKERLSKAKSDHKRAKKLKLDISVLPKRRYKDKRVNRDRSNRTIESRFIVGRDHFEAHQKAKIEAEQYYADLRSKPTVTNMVYDLDKLLGGKKNDA